jgi:ParB family chromosome partitioning protein
MEKRHGLGRGLGALLGEPAPANSGLSEVALERIDPNPQQPRRIFAPDALADLERSIRELGVLVPIIVRARGDRFELIAGERRLRAAKAAGLRRIPAMVRDVDDERSLEYAVVENLQRENLDPIEEAMGFSHLIRDYQFTQERLATRLGKSRPTIANALRLLDLTDEIKAMVQRSDISAGHARALLTLPEDRRLFLAHKAANEGLSVREIERLARREKLEAEVGPNVQPTPAKRTTAWDSVEDRLRHRYAAPVRIVGDGRGHVELSFSSEEELTRIVELLLEGAENDD